MGSRSEPVLVSPGVQPRLFHFVMIKPTHYDDDGYPIQWLRSAIPSNTLACLNGWPRTPAAANVLGPDVEIRLHTYDETNRRVRPDRIIREIRKAGGKALIALVGVQSNQFPRAVDLARPFLAAGLPVCIGGFHVSGCIAMLPEMPPDMREAQALGISLFAGEAEEGRFDAVLRDAGRGNSRRSTITWTSSRNLQGAAAAHPAAKALAPDLRLALEHRSRTRLSVPMLLLHDHQRAGPQEQIPLAGRSREDCP